MFMSSETLPQSMEKELLRSLIDDLDEKVELTSVNLSTAPSWVGVPICWRLGRPCSGTWAGWIDGLRPTA